MPLVGLLKFVSFTRSLVIKFWATAPAASALACGLETQPIHSLCELTKEELMAKGYLIALVKMTNPDNFMANYGSVVADVFAKFDGRFLVRTPDVTHHEGRQFDVHVIAEFPSVEKATEALGSDEYKSIKAHRTDNSDTEYGSFMLAEGLE